MITRKTKLFIQKKTQMKCIYCNQTAKRGKDDCTKCYNMGGSMPPLDFIALSQIISSAYTNPRVARQIKRPVSHVLCPNELCKARNANYKVFQYQQRKKGGNLNFSKYTELVHQPCAYCRHNEAMGIDRIMNTRGYHEDNVVPCCALCNFVKGRYDTKTFLNQMRKISNNWSDLFVGE